MKIMDHTMEKQIIDEIKELKKKINEVKRTYINNKSSILLQNFDQELSDKIKYYTSQYN